MPTPIKMPDFGTAVNEVRIVKWLIEPGGSVERGSLLAEVETDKAATELESAAEGVLLKQCVAAGEVAEAGQVIAWVGKAGEAAPEEEEKRGGGEARIAPVVVNLAKKLGVDVRQVKGTGERGAVTREDVLRAARGPAAAPEGEELGAAQAAVARAVGKSHAEIPHLRIAALIDMTAARRWREAGAGYDAIFVKAMAKAQEAVPAFGRRLEGQRLIAAGGVHIAVAVGFGEELVLPVVRDADKKSVGEIQREIEELAGRAKRRALQTGEMTGASTALSNLGMYPVEWFEAVIFPGHSAILAVGAVGARAVVREGRVEARPAVVVTLAADHRFINGRTAAEYLSKVKEVVESGGLE